VLAIPRTTAELPRAISDLVATDEYKAARAAALDDGRRAVEISREIASRYDVRPETIGMIGFSAGAYLTVDVAMDPGGAAPLAFIAPIYGGETLGRPVPADAPPMFAAVARDDVLYKICEGVYIDWSDADRPCELHVFARGQHGFGLVEQGMPSDRWPELFLAWLTDVVG
jgi:acetyl esterase/lipase